MSIGDKPGSIVDRLIAFFLENPLIALIFGLVVISWGGLVAPFDWDLGSLPRDPVPVDAIPDYGENQQIVFTNWAGRSPQDVEDQITYPLTVSLLGIPKVKTIRSSSAFGFSSIYVIFEDDAGFDWSRTRVLEKLASLPPNALPAEARPVLGPDATPLGQVFWYTLEGRDEQGKPAGGWDLEELRSVQDWTVRFSLMSAPGVSEVSSIGGFVREYQVDVDPDAMRAHGVRLDEVFEAVRKSNVDVGARTIEINRVEYVIRGLGLLGSVEDIEDVVVHVTDNVPIRIRDVAHVSEGPALRRGALDKDGSEAVGGVVVARYGANPLEVSHGIHEKIAEIAGGLPSKTLDDGTVSRVTIVPFYDRAKLIGETLNTLSHALYEEILVTVIVVLLMLRHLRAAGVVSGLVPVAVLACFVLMKLSGVDANVVALSGIAIAIGTMVDMGIVMTENIVRRLDEAKEGASRLPIVLDASREVGGAIVVAVMTTIISFLPVFSMEGAEGKLFSPLAWTKTFALCASIVLSLVLIPPFSLLVFRAPKSSRFRWSSVWRDRVFRIAHLVIAGAVTVWLVDAWLPLGADKGFFPNALFIVAVLGSVLLFVLLFQHFYEQILRWCLEYKALFLSLPLVLVALGITVWASLGKEFMPRLSEGAFLYMPTTMPHASIGESMDAMRKQDVAIRSIPEVELVVGKLGRVDSALDPAPISMVETIISYHPEYILDESGERKLFRYEDGHFVRGSNGELIEDPRGRPFRQWRDSIRSEDDIWHEIEYAARVLGSTSAPRLQPIETRLVMLQTGMRAAMGVKVFGPDLETLERATAQIELLMRQVPAINPETVNADRVVGKPYLEIHIDRAAIARYGISIGQVQSAIEVAIGGRTVTSTIEGRERHPVRVRYLREFRDSLESLERILVPTPGGTQVPLGQLAEVEYRRGPMVIKGEDTRLVANVTFDRKADYDEVETVEQAKRVLETAESEGRFQRDSGVLYRFAGTYEHQVRAEARLMVVLPAALLLIFVLLHLHFRSSTTTLIVFTGIFVAWSGGFLMLWLYGQDWFLDFSIFGENLRELFQVRTYHLSVAVWVGFLALFGIATDDGVIMATYLDQSFETAKATDRAAVREAVVAAGLRRIRPCLMTVATTILALMPVLTSTGRGSDIMVPMAVPTFGGMTVALITVLVVPTLYCWRAERRLK